jgi:hypothetical protein
MPTTRYLNARHGIEIIHNDGKIQILSGSIIPTQIGVVADIGSIYLCTNGKHYVKTGSNNTDWKLFIEEAPVDDKLYGRKNNNWLNIDTATGSTPGGGNKTIQFNNENIFI